MSDPDRVKVSPTSLPDAERGHGVIITFYGPHGYDGHVFLTRDQALELRDHLDEALDVVEAGSR